MFTILFITYILSVASQLERLISAKIREKTIVAIYHNFESNSFNARVLELKYPNTKRMFKKVKTFEIGRVHRNVDLDILNIPENLQDDTNKLWLKFSLLKSLDNHTTLPLNWVGYVNLDDITLKNDSSLIQFPKHENFPVKGYTINSITNGLGSALYVTGGELYSEKDNIYSASSSFYKYNFTSKEWTDMTHSIGGKLKPSTNHKSVVIGNRYLVILGGRRQVISSKSNIYDSDNQEFEYNSLYNLTIFDTFDNSWENVNINTNIFDKNTASIQSSDILATVYKDKIFAYARGASNNRSNISDNDKYLGVLDLESKNWTWSPILNYYGKHYKSSSYERDLIVFNDQIIIFSDYIGDVNDVDYIGGFNYFDSVNETIYVPITVYNIARQRIGPYLTLPNSWKDNSDYYKDEKLNLPIYAIVLIALSWGVLPGAFMFLLHYISEGSSSSEICRVGDDGVIREVWANPDINSANSAILWDKKKGLKIKKNSPNASNASNSNILGSNTGTLNISNTIEFDK